MKAHALAPFAGAAATALLFAVVARGEAPWHLLVFVVWAPWLWSLEGAALGPAMGSAAFCAMGFCAGVYSFVPGTLAAYSNGSLAVAWFASLVFAPLVLEPFLFAVPLARLAARRLSSSRLLIGCATALATVGAEWALPKLFADTAGYALYPSAVLRQAADLGGARGLTLVTLLSSECAAAALISFRQPRRALRPALGAALLVSALYTYGALRLRQIESLTRAAPAYTAGIVQAAIGSYDKLAAEKGAYDAVEQILSTHLTLSAQLQTNGPLDLLVWPETVYPTTFGAPKTEDQAELDRRIAGLVAQTGVPLVFGAFEDSEAGEHNAAFFLAPSQGGVAFETYRKALLFPMTEHVPRWLDSPRLRAALPWTGRWEPGPGARTVALGLRDGTALELLPLICYEAIDAGYVASAARQGADAIVTLSNDAWFTSEAAPRLHLVSAAFRSIELRLPQLRATNSGISALVLPSGELVSPTAFGERAAVRVAVPRLSPVWTPVRALGDFLGPVALVLVAALFAVLFLQGSANRSVSGAAPAAAPSRGTPGASSMVASKE